MAYALGHIADPFDQNDKSVPMSEMGMTDAFESRYSLISNIGTAEGPRYPPHLFDQGQIGSCTANAVAAAYIYEMRRQGVKEGGGYVPSRLFLYYVARFAQKGKGGENRPAEFFANLATNPPTVPIRTDNGSYTREVVKIMKGLGAPPEFWNVAPIWGWPYQDAKPEEIEGEKVKVFPPDMIVSSAPPAGCFEMARRHLALNYARPHLDFTDPVETIKCWKACIKKGYPIMFGFTFFDSAYQLKDGRHVVPLPDPSKERRPPGGHAVLAVGWDDKHYTADDKQEGCFLVQNSWGLDAGDPLHPGCFWMPYTWFERDDQRGQYRDLISSPWTFFGSTEHS